MVPCCSLGLARPEESGGQYGTIALELTKHPWPFPGLLASSLSGRSMALAVPWPPCLASDGFFVTALGKLWLEGVGPLG